MLIAPDVERFIEREGLLTPHQTVVVGVSGGPDSLCLLDCLDRLDYDVRVAHLDHGLRRGSWREAEFVLREARRRGLPAVAERVPTGELSRAGRSVEEAGRLARYRFLVRAAREWGAAVIAVGHTADDQAETILMHFLRGAGVHGLRGMLPRTPLRDWTDLQEADGIDLVRPLLAVWRSQTEAHCRAARLRPPRDSTNDDPAFFRNRLRHELLPLLESYNPRIRPALTRTGDVMRREADVVDEILKGVEPTTVHHLPDGTAVVRREAFRAQPIGVQRALLGRLVPRLSPGLRDIGFDALDLARARLQQRLVGRRTTLPGGVELLDQGDTVIFIPAGVEVQYLGFPQLATPDPTRIRLPGRLKLREGSLVASMAARLPSEMTRRTTGLTDAVWLDRRSLEAGLVVRPPRPGDRMRPLGMGGHRKLADIFNSRRIPAGARRAWPVVTSGEHVLWLSGLSISHDARLTSSTRQAVQLRIELAEEAAG